MANQGMKIAVIGGGSSYTPELIEGLIQRHHNWGPLEVWLMDIEKGREKLEIVGDLAKRMVAKANGTIQIHLTCDRREALAGADFVIIQIRVGLLEARIKDECIPLKHGIIGQETNGAGGLMKGLRTIPVVLDIADEVQELCPDAWLINFTNPAGMVTEALLCYGSHHKVVGVCNVPVHMTATVADMLGVDKERIHIHFAGLNHLVHGLNIFLDGEEITEDLLQRLTDPDQQMTLRNIDPLPWQPEFITSMGVLLCPYHRYYYKTKEILEEELVQFQSGTTRGKVVKEVEEELFSLYQNPDLNEKPSQLEKRGGAYYSDAACQLIDSIFCNRQTIQTLNVQNNGAIAGIPYRSAVEVNCVVTKNGPKPLAVGELPVEINGLVQQIKSFERVAVEAAVTGSYEKALLAMTIHPLVPSDQTAKRVLDELLEAHHEYLPHFFSSQR
ncbi:6-phospho-beta-glucosidase [Melghirimyces algeriensis]|uniref:6-phospho-beta-glucosidase n=1 Tax=Melghirimyces algeriensis TaxID=910412 RepID=A0A521ERV2_9BACL|nr:6-phospho-beta-glucosidase [Melghirimyces algeriensis]SMO86659.1 6-phospho-beta-glucosidase [Melghirimyces algeriensis]